MASATLRRVLRSERYCLEKRIFNVLPGAGRISACSRTCGLSAAIQPHGGVLRPNMPRCGRISPVRAPRKNNTDRRVIKSYSVAAHSNVNGGRRSIRLIYGVQTFKCGLVIVCVTVFEKVRGFAIFVTRHAGIGSMRPFVAGAPCGRRTLLLSTTSGRSAVWAYARQPRRDAPGAQLRRYRVDGVVFEPAGRNRLHDPVAIDIFAVPRIRAQGTGRRRARWNSASTASTARMKFKRGLGSLRRAAAIRGTRSSMIGCVCEFNCRLSNLIIARKQLRIIYF